jgi:hypothetical protein
MTPTERVREWRARQPKRKCECGRELEKYCDYCSECSYVRRQIKLDGYRHTYKTKLKEAIS